MMLAHAISPGLGGFYSGLLHPLAALDQLLALGALGLLGGRSSARCARSALAAVLAGCLLAIPCSALWPAYDIHASLPMLSMLAVLGAALASGVRVSTWMLAPAGMPLGLVACWSAVPAAMSGDELIVVIAGASVAAGGLALLASGLARRLSAGARWQRVALRVAGSWSCAIAIILLALEFP